MIAALSASSAYSAWPDRAGDGARAGAAQAESARGGGGRQGTGGASELSKEQQAQVDKLKERDRQVRQHEQAHLAAAGGLAMSGPTYSYQKGPDGVRYAVGGEVNIDTSPGRSPEETVAKARQIRAAALAPAEPSGQDRAVAAQASQMEMQAQVELARQGTSGAGGSGKASDKESGKPSSEPEAAAVEGNAEAGTSARADTAAGRQGVAAYQSIQQSSPDRPGWSGPAAPEFRAYA